MRVQIVVYTNENHQDKLLQFLEDNGYDFEEPEYIETEEEREARYKAENE